VEANSAFRTGRSLLSSSALLCNVHRQSAADLSHHVLNPTSVTSPYSYRVDYV